MAARRLNLFCEDAGHEAFARAAVERIAAEQQVDVSIGVASSRAGLGHMQRELRAYTETVRHRSGTPDLLVVLADGNAVGPNARRSEIDGLELGEVFPVWIVGVPDPCVEAWLLADSGALKDAFGQSPPSPIPTGSDGLKQYLKSYLEESGEIVTQGGVEFADEIVAAMNLYRAGKNESTLKRFFDDLRAAMK